jgi:hypothetical protein
MSSMSIDLIFGLALTALVAGAISAAVMAARQPSSWHPTWVVRSLTLGVGAVGTLVLWFAAIALAPAA